ncbi:hypothetical protein HDU76_010167 [Blyttiomyces sp. JEL0837]|nr:hypothetical protein HDU76_010167 [Blyttiomyces sp. JEL0837]
MSNNNNESRPLLSRGRQAISNTTKAAKTWMDDFKSFVARGNVVDLATGVIIGGAFGAIVSSIVDDILSPFISLFVGTQLQNAFLYLRDPDPALCKQKQNPCTYFATPTEAHEYGAITLNYGHLLQLTINFFIVALILFLFIRLYTRFAEKWRKAAEAQKKKEEDEVREEVERGAPVVEVRTCPFCVQEIPRRAVKCMYCASEVGVFKEERGGQGDVLVEVVG